MADHKIAVATAATHSERGVSNARSPRCVGTPGRHTATGRAARVGSTSGSQRARAPRHPGARTGPRTSCVRRRARTPLLTSRARALSRSRGTSTRTSRARGVTAQGALVPGEIYVSQGAGGGFGPAVAVGALNGATSNDIQPNVRKDGREVVFSSNRAGGQGDQDIWVSSRASTSDQWATPVNLGSAVNTGAAESRPSLSWDAEQLLFGRAPGPEGSSDIYVTTRVMTGK